MGALTIILMASFAAVISGAVMLIQMGGWAAILCAILSVCYFFMSSGIILILEANNLVNKAKNKKEEVK